MGGSSEGDAASVVTTTDPEAYKPWIKEKVLGTGGFGTVILWKNGTNGETIALKKCRWGASGVSAASDVTFLSPEHQERWQKEVQIMLRLEHPGIVSCFPVPPELEGKRGELPMLCMEYCSGGDLRRLLNKPENCCGIKELEVRTCLKDLTEAVGYLHSQRIIHRDLKPENIVLQDIDGMTRYKLIDLGYAKELEYTSVCTSFVGTLQYLAPELFLSKRYSCTVDYWSLGLVVHEIITGIRPFLPNMSPVEWMKRVRSKRSSHICVYEARNGDVQFSETMFEECHISKPLKSLIETWLQLMLEWDPSKRGQVESSQDDKKVVIAFTKCAELLTRKVIRVLVVEGCKLVEYEITPSTSLAELQENIAKDSGVIVSDQKLLLPRGHPPDQTKPAMQCWAPPEEEDWMLYVFSDSVVPPHIAPHFPSLVEEMLRSPRAMVEYSLQRKMYSHALFFLQRETKLLCALMNAQKVAMLHLLSSHSELTRCGQRVLNDIAKLQARHHLFMESLNNDLDHYTSQPPHARISSDKAYGAWRGGGETTLSAVHSAVDKTQKLDSSLTGLNTKVMELNSSPFANVKTASDPMHSIVSSCEELLVNLKKRPREDRSKAQDSTPMCKLLLQALRKRDRFYQDLYTHMEKQSSCLQEVAALSIPLAELLQDIARTAQTISNLQQKRQDDIWKIMAIVASHSRKGIDGPPSGDLPRAEATPQTVKNLEYLLEQSVKEDEAIMQENRVLRTQMMELFQNMLPSDLNVSADNTAKGHDLQKDFSPRLPPKLHKTVVESNNNPTTGEQQTKTALLQAKRTRAAVETAL